MMIQQPKFFAIAGAPGVGKTTLRQQLTQCGQIDGSYFIYSDDDLLHKMPGYLKAAKEDFYSAREIYIKEVWKIVDPALETALKAGKNIVYDRTCSRDINFQIMQKAISLSYYVEMHALTTDFLSAHYRIAKREGQWRKGQLRELHGVRPDAQEKTNAAFSKIFFDYAFGTKAAQPLNKVTLWKSGATNDLIAEYQNGNLVQIHNNAELEKFKSKAGWVNQNADVRRAAMGMYVR